MTNTCWSSKPIVIDLTMWIYYHRNATNICIEVPVAMGFWYMLLTVFRSLYENWKWQILDCAYLIIIIIVTCDYCQVSNLILWCMCHPWLTMHMIWLCNIEWVNRYLPPSVCASRWNISTQQNITIRLERLINIFVPHAVTGKT